MAETAVNHVYTQFNMPTQTFASNTAFLPVPAFLTPPSGAGGLGLETEQYFFHPDHLGSSNYITNFVGEVSQHSEYFAFGESFVEEHKNSHNSPYKFNGKELDEESGLYYYGARYYDPRISIWASVDPLVEQTSSSYGYCYQNPVNLVDPNGKIPIVPMLIKFGVGASVDMMAQMTMSYLFDSSVNTWGQAFDKVNWKQVGISGALAAIPWNAPGGKWGKAGFAGATDVMTNALSQDDYSLEQAGTDFALGFIIQLAGGKFADFCSKYGSSNVAKGLVTKLGMAAKKVHSLTGVWHSATDGNFVGKLANQLGELVDDIDVNYKFSGGAGDVDISTKNFNIEVKSGNKMKLNQSHKNSQYAKDQGKGYLLYMPKATKKQIQEAANQGVRVVTNPAELKKIVK
ncbi:RHS repeat domain-containing protein [Flavobacterium branchiophilum]|uniref:RHS repeat domain-containing protein n=1 Tax=Flavobacterium branchiophilum TaxID=55197 RepID=UPI001E5D200C|nr:RHS repeat-associated core domain-containing protein [Flavobacterium branchiophilum]